MTTPFAPEDRPALGVPFALELRDERAFVVRRADAQPLAALTPFEAVALGVLDGARPWREVLELLEVAAGPSAHASAIKLAQRLRPLLAANGGRASDVPLARLSRVAAPRLDDGVRALPGPRVLHWWVTSVCPRRCVYCFAEPLHGGSAPDATLARARLAELFAEAATLGTRSLLVAGAEPLLRPDLPEVMGDAIASGIDPVVTTKHAISRPYAERLARAGVRHVSFSLDAVDEETNARLIGAAGYARRVRQSFAHLREVGIAFSLQAVVTSLNPDSFADVVELGAEQGARVVQVVPYEPVRRPIGEDDNDVLALRSDAPVRARVAELQTRFPGLRVELFEQLGQGDRAAYQCDIGMTKLFFLADGTVHRCYKLRDDARLRGRSLVEHSVAAAWHDPGFREVIAPPRHAYAGSSCGTCERFDGCHDEGRCLYRAVVDHGRYEAPDRACPRNDVRRLPVLS